MPSPPVLLLALHLVLLPLSIALTPETRLTNLTLATQATSHAYTHTFASRTRATLYLNGHRIAALPASGGRVVITPSRPPRRGDVYTIVASQPTSSKSIRPGVFFSCPAARTGPAWRAAFSTARAARATPWRRRFFYVPVCRWRRARARANAFIWPRSASAASANQLARFRFVVGAADDKTCKGKPATLFVAATDRAWVFLNGRHVEDVLSKRRARKVELRLSKGDVIAVKAMDVVPVRRTPHEYGFAADLLVGGRHFTTRPGRGPWRMVAMYDAPDAASKFAFMRSGFDDCAWPRPVAPRHAPRSRAAGFPFRYGAKYVWASDAQRPRSVVFARMVVGGGANRCRKVDGQGDDPLPETCPCEMVQSAKGSVCYYFKDTRKHVCDMRQCEPKYVCTGKDISSSGALICVRKEVVNRIVRKEGYQEPGTFCKLKHDPHHIYVPYGNGASQW